MPGPDGKIVHAEIQIGDSILMIGEEAPQMGAVSPKQLGGSPVTIMLYVNDVDTWFNRATKAGQFPVIADLMAAGTVSLTAVRLVGPHLTNENHEAVLAKAANKAKAEIQELVAPLRDAAAKISATVAQAAEWLHHRNEIREAREALHGELVVNASSLRTNLLEDQCLLSAMDYDERALKGETLPPRKLPNSVIFNYPVSTVWDAVRSGAVTRMGLDEKLAYARFYSRATRHQRAADRALDYLSHLRGYRETGTPTPAETRLILQYTGRAQTALTAKFQIEQQMLAEAKALGGRPVPISSVEQTMLQTECGSAGVPVGKID